MAIDPDANGVPQTAKSRYLNVRAAYREDLRKVKVAYAESLALPAEEWIEQLGERALAVEQIFDSVFPDLEQNFSGTADLAVEALSNEDRTLLEDALQKRSQNSLGHLHRTTKLAASSSEARALVEIAFDEQVFSDLARALTRPDPRFYARNPRWREFMKRENLKVASSKEANDAMFVAADAAVFTQAREDAKTFGVEYALRRAEALSSPDALLMIRSFFDGAVLAKARAARDQSTKGELSEFVHRNASSSGAAAKMYEALGINPYREPNPITQTGAINPERQLHHNADLLFRDVITGATPEFLEKLAPYLDSQVLGAFGTIVRGREGQQATDGKISDIQTARSYTNSISSNPNVTPARKVRAEILGTFVESMPTPTVAITQ